MFHRITSPEDSLICSLCSEIACMVNWGTSVWEGISAKIIVALFILHNSVNGLSIEDYYIFFPDSQFLMEIVTPFLHTPVNPKSPCAARVRRDPGGLFRFFCTWMYSGYPSPGSQVMVLNTRGRVPLRDSCAIEFPICVWRWSHWECLAFINLIA